MFLTAKHKKTKIFVLLGDILLLATAFFIAIYIKQTFIKVGNSGWQWAPKHWFLLLWIGFYPLILYVFELYYSERWRSNLKLALFIASTLIGASFAVSILSYILIPHIIIGKVTLALHIAISVFFLFTLRKIALNIVQKDASEKILIIGNDSIVDDIRFFLRDNRKYGLSTIDVINNFSEFTGVVNINGTNNPEGFTDFVKASGYHCVIIAENLKDLSILSEKLINLKFSGVKIYDAAFYYHKISGKVPVSHVRDNWFIFQNHGKRFNPASYRNVKIFFDKTLALSGLIICSPLMILISVLIKMGSKGPVLFRQERLGQDETNFVLIKFRTMIDNAEKDTGPKWAGYDDPRITKIGKILRKSRLDELPQLINILKGDMSFVGPRPIRRHFADVLAKNIPYYRLRFSVKPGLTGWAQVKGDYAGSKDGQEEKLQYDLYYIKNQSLLFDFYIMLKTVQTVLFQRGT